MLPAGPIALKPQHRPRFLVLNQSGAVDAPNATQTRLDDPFARTNWHLSEEDTAT
jgi:hypothetical protein